MQSQSSVTENVFFKYIAIAQTGIQRNYYINAEYDPGQYIH